MTHKISRNALQYASTPLTTITALRRSLLLALCVSAPMKAQEVSATRRHTINGVVFDSVVGRPLEGAVVQLATGNAIDAPYVASTDSAGRYRFTGIPAGSFVIGFYHDRLTALGLDAPTQRLEVSADSLLTVNLAVPSSRTIRTLRCGESPFETSSGMMVGFVRGGDQLSVPRAALHLGWRALALDSSNFRVTTARVAAQIDEDGSYLACHVPMDVPLDLDITAPGYRSLRGRVAMVPANGIGRMDIALVDSAGPPSHGVLRGHVTRPGGKPVSSGRVVLAALGREVPIRDGEFVFDDVPSGSWVVEVRVIGGEPQEVLVQAKDSAPPLTEISVGEQVQQLDAVTIIGTRDRNAAVLDEVLRRKRLGFGTVFLPGSPALKSALFTADVMREARGFQYRSPTEIVGRVTGKGARCTNIAVYVNDVKQPYGFVGLDDIAPPNEVLAIETFPDILLAPIQYRISKFVLGAESERYCAVVLVWTKR